MSSLERAICIASAAHEGQRDKVGAPYILHPLRVMMKMPEGEARIVAVLHDVVEDTPWTLSALRGEGFSELVLSTLDRVTRRAEESYEQFVARAAEHPLSTLVKIGDLEDNSDPARILNVTEADRLRLEKYARALAFLRGRG